MGEDGASPTTMGHGRRKLLERKEKGLRDHEIVSYLGASRHVSILAVRRSCRLHLMDEVPTRQPRKIE